MIRSLHAADALLPTGWAREVRLDWSADGQLTRVTPDTARDGGLPLAKGPVLPGVPNLHSHAFQRAFAGLTEYRAEASDSFWSWRTLMYRFAARLTPQQVEAIATWLYVEMIEAGYTAVCEFHYLHHDTDGRPYADDAELALALLRAARRTGIGLTLLPVLYQTSGFGGRAPNESQRRFIRSTTSMLRLLERLQPLCAAQGARLGLAPHSLRAVPPDSLREALAGLDALDPSAPVHLHIAEQTAEVDACLAWSGQRPVEWLLDHAAVDARWCLVHATHLSATEYTRAAATGAVAGLCPSTEANLGDGLFDLLRWRNAGGLWGLGSDSHACVDAAEEILLLEYGQRLQRRQRNVGATAAQPEVATALLLDAVHGGARACGRLGAGGVAGLVPGQPADLVELSPDHLAGAGLPRPQDRWSTHVFASRRHGALHTTRIAGQALTTNGRHLLHDEAAAAFIATRSELLA